MREFEIEEKLDRVLIKLHKKDRKAYEIVFKKIKEIIGVNDVEHYKNLRKPLHEFKRVHIDPFVLVFKYDKTRDKIIFHDFDHHDKIYK